MNKIIPILLLFFCCSVNAVSSTLINGATKERIYVQTDKNLYLSGETMLVKVITTDQNGVPTDLSKVAYIELLGEEEAKIQLKVTISNSSGSGYLQIPIDCATGIYRLAGYTQFMRNEGPEVFFEKGISILNTWQKIEVSSADSTIVRKNHTAQKHGGIAVLPDKEKYMVRERGTVAIENIPEDIVSLSVIITGNDRMEEEIASLSLADWKSNLKKQAVLPLSNEFLPEYEGHIVRGKLFRNSEADQRGTNITPFLSFQDEKLRLFKGTINENDEVLFVTKRADNFRQAITTVFEEPNSGEYRIDLLSPFARHTFREIPSLTIPETWIDDLQKRHTGLQTAYLFDPPVTIDESTIEPLFQWTPDVVYNLDDYTRFSTMEDVVIEILSTVRFHKIAGKRLLQVLMKDNALYAPVPALVLLNGVPVQEHDDLFNYSPEHIKRVDIYRSRFVFGNFASYGIVHFISYNNELPGFKPNESTQFLSYEMPRENIRLQTPDYSSEEAKKSPLPDFRHILLWNPEVKAMDEKEVILPFWTSDYTGEFIVKVEGMTKSGTIVYSEKTITVMQ